MFQEILNLLDVITKTNESLENVDPAELHAFLEGLAVAREAVVKTEEFIKDELAYEVFDRLFGIFSEILEPEQVEEIIDAHQEEEE